VSESDIVRAICDYLALRKYFFWRQNTAPSVQKSADSWQFRRMPVHAMRGVPDIILIRKDGYFVGIEVKTDKGRMSPEQLLFAKRSKAIGAEYYVVHSIEEVQALGF
jgi:hypothetical protein